MPGESYADCVARLAGELRAAELDRDRYSAAIERVRAIHVPTPEWFANGDVRQMCNGCGDWSYWPCDTIRALDPPGRGTA